MADEVLDKTIEQLERGVGLTTGKEHVLRVQPPQLHVRLPIDPADVSSWNDKYTLLGTGPTGDSEIVRTVSDDQVPGDAAVDLVYPIFPGHRYSLRIELGDPYPPFFLFEDLPFTRLK